MAEYCTPYRFRLTAMDSGYEYDEEIGEIRGRFFDVNGLIAANLQPVYLMDTIDQDTWDMYESVYKITKTFSNRNLFFIDAIILKEQFRGAGIGSIAMCRLQSALKEQFGKEVGLIVVMPWPMEYQEAPEDYKRTFNYRDTICIDNDSKDDSVIQRIYGFFMRLGFGFSKNGRVLYLNTQKSMRLRLLIRLKLKKREWPPICMPK